jgi:hypothetical protein
MPDDKDPPIDSDERPPTEEVDPEEVSRWRRLARRFTDRRELAEDTRDLLAAFLSTSDKAKSELIRMTGREVRHYLDGLQLKEDLLDIATNYRLEVRASFHLEPIARALSDEPAPTESEAGPDGSAPEPDED